MVQLPFEHDVEMVLHIDCLREIMVIVLYTFIKGIATTSFT